MRNHLRCYFSPGVEYRKIDGTHTKSLDALFDVFAEAWHFPARFASNHSRDAFDDWMRDFDNSTNLFRDKPPASAYVTDIHNAHLILANQSDMFPWFTETIPFYRDYYRDELDPPAAFAVVLSAPADSLDEVRTRWLSVNAQVAELDD